MTSLVPAGALAHRSACGRGHKALIEEGLKRVGQVCIAVRDTQGTDNKNPLSFTAVKERIEAALFAHAGRVLVVQVPNVTHFYYGREVGYVVEKLELSEEMEKISGTEQRKLMGLDRA